MSKYITTFSKVHFAPTAPVAEDIKIEDIAHALSLICRANGHFKQFFSVAQHSINCAAEAKARGYSEKVQLACLLHDASEAYLADITRPVKPYLTEYLSFEEKLQGMIYDKFLDSSLTENESEQVDSVDDSMLYYEFLELMNEKVFETEPELKGKPNFEERDFKAIEHLFLNTYRKLTKDTANPFFPDRKFVSVGVDGCVGKWLVVAITESEFEVNIFNAIGDVCEKYNHVDSIIIDMPIGLPESPDDIRPDSELRKRLKGKASCVFNTPCRQAVYAPNYTKAKEENKKVLDVFISRQSNAMIPKIHEVDRFLQENPQWKNRLSESHPEFCFAIVKSLPDGEVKQLVGHSKNMDTFGVYGHELDGDTEKAANDVELILEKIIEKE